MIHLKKLIMKKNVGNIDRAVRLLLAAVFITLFALGKIEGTLGIVLVVLGSVFALTSFVGFCPLYSLFGLSTCPVKKTN
jgi:hypothetical protein